MREQRKEGYDDALGLNIWWNLNRLRDSLRKAGQINATTFSQELNGLNMCCIE